MKVLLIDIRMDDGFRNFAEFAEALLREKDVEDITVIDNLDDLYKFVPEVIMVSDECAAAMKFKKYSYRINESAVVIVGHSMRVEHAYRMCKEYGDEVLLRPLIRGDRAYSDVLITAIENAIKNKEGRDNEK